MADDALRHIDPEEWLRQTLAKHGQMVEARLRKALSEYGIEDPLEVEIAIKSEKLRYYEIVDPPENVLRLRVYAYGDNYLFTDIVMNTNGDFDQSLAHAEAQLLIANVVLSQKLRIRNDEAGTT